MTDQQALTRTYDAYLIKNVMGRHAYYHALGQHRKELDTIWSKRDDISWANGAGFWVGRDTLYAYYADAKEAQDRATLELMAKKDPTIEVKPENDQMGALLMHSLTTPLIEVDGDGKTAQAMWYSLGQVTNAGADGKATGTWMHERYAVDFIKEEDGWKIWHFFVGTDLGCPAGQPFTDAPPMGQAQDPEDAEAMRKIFEALPKPTIPMKLYSNQFGWCNYPQFPVPHETHTAALSYGPDRFAE